MKHFKKLFMLLLLVIITVSFFPSFTKVEAAVNVPIIKYIGMEHSPLLSGDTQTFYISSDFNNKVQYRVFLYSYSTKKKIELTKGYSTPVHPKTPYIIKSTYVYKNGKYRLEILIKSKDSTKNFDSSKNYDFECVTRDKRKNITTTGSMYNVKDNYSLGEKVAISGIKGIYGMKSPYKYKLSIYSVRKNQVVYSESAYNTKAEWTPKEVGPYILTLYVNSKGSKAKYDAIKQKVIYVKTTNSMISGKITLDSTKDDVISLLGDPFSTKYDYGCYVMSYDNVDLYLDHTYTPNVVIGWKNKGNPLIYLGNKNPNAPAFTLGSYSYEVLNAMGTPEFLPPYLLNNDVDFWVFSDESVVFFNQDEEVASYLNNGSLKISLGLKNPFAQAINLNSTFEDVLKAMGTPDALYINGIATEDNTICWFGDSYFVFDENGKIIFFNNEGNLKINLGSINPDAPKVTEGSSIQDIINAMGTPNAIASDTDFGKSWVYGNSLIGVDDNGNVNGWVNMGDLKVSVGEKSDSAPPIKIGSSKSDVALAMGTPNKLYENKWFFGNSIITFDDLGSVISIENADKNIKISTSQYDESAPAFTVDSTADDVVKAMGTPDSITLDSETGDIIWKYGASTISFSDEELVKNWNDTGNLKVIK